MLLASVSANGKVSTFPNVDPNGVVDVVWDDGTGEIQVVAMLGQIDRYGLVEDVFVKKTADGVMVDRDSYENDVYVRKTDGNSVFIDREGSANDLGIRHNGEDSIIIQGFSAAQNDVIIKGKGKSRI